MKPKSLLDAARAVDRNRSKKPYDIESAIAYIKGEISLKQLATALYSEDDGRSGQRVYCWLVGSLKLAYSEGKLKEAE